MYKYAVYLSDFMIAFKQCLSKNNKMHTSGQYESLTEVPSSVRYTRQRFATIINDIILQPCNSVRVDVLCCSPL